jgi:dTDP-4-dehydrorhamnose 3,5-epimerase
MHGVNVTPLKIIATIGGDVLHAIKSSDSGFMGFGEAYFSMIGHNQVKAWKLHTKMTMNLVVPVGSVDFVFFDSKNFKTVRAGKDSYVRITVAPNIWFGFKGVGHENSLILNLANIEHDSIESKRLPIGDIQFNWENT